MFSYAYYGRILSRSGGNPYVNTRPTTRPTIVPIHLVLLARERRRLRAGLRGHVLAHTAVFRSIPDVIVAFRATRGGQPGFGVVRDQTVAGSVRPRLRMPPR